MDTLVAPTKEQIQQFYSHALQRSRDAYAQLDDKEWGKKASDKNTAREHLAILVSTMERETIPLTLAALAGEKPNIPGFSSRSETIPFREQGVAELSNASTADLLARFKAAFGEHLGMLETLSEADLDKPAISPAWDRPGTVRDLFFAAYLFLPGQYQEIRKVARKKLPHWIQSSTPDQVNYHMGRIFHYMPLIFRSDRGADINATYLFTMEGEGGGQWALQLSGGKASSQDGAPLVTEERMAQEMVEIKTRPELWLDLTNGELNPAMAILTRKVKIGGNAGLAMKLSDLFSAEE